MGDKKQECECCNPCEIFDGEPTPPFPIHTPYAMQVELSGNAGTNAIAVPCCGDFDDLILGEYLVSPPISLLDLPFDVADIRCAIDYGFRDYESMPGYIGIGNCNFPFSGYEEISRGIGAIFVQRNSTGDVFMGTIQAVWGYGSFPTPNFFYRQVGWTNLGAGPIDPVGGGPWSITSFARSEGGLCWDVTPGTVTVTPIDEAP